MGRGIALRWASVPYACWALPLAQTTHLPLILTHCPNCVVGSPYRIVFAYLVSLGFCVRGSSLGFSCFRCPWCFSTRICLICFRVREATYLLFAVWESAVVGVPRWDCSHFPPCWSRGGVFRFCCCAVLLCTRVACLCTRLCTRSFLVILPLPSVLL